MSYRPILALDLGSNTGWAVSAPEGSRPRWGSIRLGGDGATPGERYAALARWLNDFIKVNRPRLLVYEAPLPPRQVNGHSTFATARVLLGLAAVTEMVAAMRRLEVREANVQQVKKHFAGHGRADKDTIRALLKQHGIEIKRHDEGDALALLDLALHTYREPGLGAGPLFPGARL